MQNHNIITWLLLLFFCFPATIAAQQKVEIEKSLVKETIQGKDFYIHTVKNGETLFAISRVYQVSIQELQNHNFALTEGIVPGQIIKIPVVEFPELIEDNHPATDKINYRRVQQGETMYGIAREYGISVDQLKEANNGLPDGLKSGMFLKIPESLIGTALSGQMPQEEKSKGFFEYQAKEKTSIFEIAMRYRVSVDSILHYNQDVDETIRPGQSIRIPLVAHQPGFITHTVTRRESLAKLARKYGLDVNLIRTINPYISRILATGQVIRIPLLKMDSGEGPPIDQPSSENEEESLDVLRSKSLKEKCFESYKMGAYKVALLIPLYFSEIDSILLKEHASDNSFESPMFIKPFTFIQFYQGFIMAVDSLEKAGLNVELHIFNVENDLMQTSRLLENSDMSQMDFIVGPFFSQNFKMVADFAKENQIHIVNPLSTRDEVTLGNPYVFQPQPLNDNQFDVLVNFLNENHDSSRIFLAKHNQYQDYTAFARLQKTLDEQLESRKIETTSLYHEIVYSRDSLFTFMHTATPEHENVVVVYGENKLFILDLLRSLNQLRDTFPVTVIGMPNWREIEGLEYEHLNNLNTHLLSNHFTDYENPVVQKFVSAFHEKYATDPGIFAFNGYNIGAYFLGALMKFGRDFEECIPWFQMELLNMGYNFETANNRGYNNVNWKILKMEQFRLKDITRQLETYDLSKPPGKYYRYMDLE
jgi:LysM repeat protein